MANAKKTTTQLNTWEAEMAASATVAAKAESKSVERPFFSTSGQLKFQGAVLPHGAAVIVVDNIHANLYYQGVYDPNSPTSPDCYAFGRDVADPKTGEVTVQGVDTWNGSTVLGPHKDVVNRQHTDCATCPLNQWGSGVGKGKACQNTRRLAAVPAGTMQGEKFVPFTKPEQIESAQLGYVKLPTMSVPGFSKLVLDTAQGLSRPIWSMATLMRVVPNPSGRLPATVVQFDNLATIPNALMDAVYKRRKLAEVDITFPFQPNQPKTVSPAGAKPKPKRKYV
jgi:hypothetical protein